jgi:hypothetical protein
MTDSDRKRLISYLEAAYWMDGFYPNFSALKRSFPDVPSADLKLALESLTEALSNRGLPAFFSETKFSANEPDPEFLLACNSVLDLTDQRSVTAKLKEFGFTTKKWQGWLKRKPNREYFDKLFEERFADVDTNAKLALSKNVMSGDLQSIKYYHEFTGKFRPSSQAEVIVLSQLVVRLMEILAKYVEPDVLAQVADEIEGVEILELT